MSNKRFLLAASFMGAVLTTAYLSSLAAPKPIKVMLISGGCCHDYATQKELLKNGLEARANVVIDQIYTADSSTKPTLPIYTNPDYAKGYDLVIHNECGADVQDLGSIDNVMKPHEGGIPAVLLHCAMHSYRQPDFEKKVEKTGQPGTRWFEFVGIQSTGHGAQRPIQISYSDKTHPITKVLPDWTTGKEELYNNVTIFDSAHPLALGKQGDNEKVLAWTNLYKNKTRVFATTLGHNTETVQDARYLDLVAKGVLWATGKLDSQGQPMAGYGPVTR